MIKFKLFHLPRPKQFNYIPRYYDPEKDRLEQRKKEIARERGEYVAGAGIHGAFRQRLKSKRASDRNSMIRLIVIISALLLLFYWLLMR
ncbi:MAG TPA: hypothetical protein PK990_01075 [Salinivirgaceae bacterium]|nr:hypothetical protein [Salinivirgaceae bacterium]